MRVATFGPTTAWVGKGIEHDGRQFILEGHGPIPPQAVLDYDRLGQIDWAYDGLREWTQAVARQAGGATASPGAATQQLLRPSTRRVRFPWWAIVLVATALAVLAAAIIVPVFLTRGEEAKSYVQTGPGGGRPGQFTVTLQSDAGDYIGGGKSYHYTQDNATLSLEPDGNHLTVNLTPADWNNNGWQGDFEEPSGLHVLQQGMYANLSRYPFHDPAKGGFDWSGEGRGSNTLTGWFAIERVAYEGGELSALTLRFEQHSDGAAPALRGQIQWTR